MKNRFFVALFFTSFFSFAQITITGTVYEKNNPLEGVAVYFNNTMVGTTTNEKGAFSIKIKEGQYDLIISYLGYKKINYSLNTTSYNKPLIFNLVEEQNILDEIVIKKVIYDDEWKYNLQVFKDNFIGRTELSKGCEILNPKALNFNFDAKQNILTAYATEPLLVKNKNLGYLITFELEDFTKQKEYVTYIGYSRYEALKGGKSKQKKWKKNRTIAHNGSIIHFFKSLINNSITEEGYIVHQFKRILNPDRPSDEKIKKARELIKLSSSSINFSKTINEPKTAIDSALWIVRKARLPKFKDYLYKSKISRDEIIKIKNDETFLDFENNLSVVYTKEKEEQGYILRNAFSKLREALPQTSSVIPFKMPLKLEKSGILTNPLNAYFEGYWSYEKFGNTLPLDYEPHQK